MDHEKRRTEEEASFIRSDRFLRELKELNLIPADTSYVAISVGGDEFIRINYDHTEDGTPVATTARLFRTHATEVARILTALAEAPPQI